MHTDRRLAIAALGLGLLGSGVQFLWPDAKWFGRLLIILAFGTFLCWGWVEVKSLRSNNKPAWFNRVLAGIAVVAVSLGIWVSYPWFTSDKPAHQNSVVPGVPMEPKATPTNRPPTKAGNKLKDAVFIRHDAGSVGGWDSELGRGYVFASHDEIIDILKRSEVREPGQSLAQNERVTFDIFRGSDGVEARNVRVIPPQSEELKPSSSTKVLHLSEPVPEAKMPLRSDDKPTPVAPEEKPVFVRHEVGVVLLWYARDGTGSIDTPDRQIIHVKASNVLEPGKSLAQGEKVEYDVMRGPRGVEAINVKVVPVPKKEEAPPNAPRAVEPIPDNVTITLPKKMNLSKVECEMTSESTGRLATDIKVCIVRERSRRTDEDVASSCNYLYASYVADLRNKLRNSGIVLEPLQDVVRRMERGADLHELEYASRVMDLLSQELGKRAK